MALPDRYFDRESLETSARQPILDNSASLALTPEYGRIHMLDE